MKKSDTLIALAYTGDHYKMREGHVPQVPHQDMLFAAIENVNPDGEFDVLVSANKFSIMDIADDEERRHIWRVVNLAAVLSMRENHGHQMGQAWAIRQALEYAGVRGHDYMFWSAEDILFDDPFMVRNAVAMMKRQEAVYIGRHWGGTWELDCQVFGCKVEPLLRLFRPQDFALRGGLIEPYMKDVLGGERVIIHPMPHHHEHDPAKFLALLPHVNHQQSLYRAL